MSNEPFGFDPDDVERMLRGAGDQLRSALGDLGRQFQSGDRPGWSTFFDDLGRTKRTREPETTGETGEGVWAIYSVDADGGARVEQVYATELDALRAHQHNTDNTRKVRFLPYGIAVSVLDTTDTSDADSADGDS